VPLTSPSLFPYRSPPSSHIVDPDGPLLAPPTPGEPVAAANTSQKLAFASLGEDDAVSSSRGTEPAAFIG